MKFYNVSWFNKRNPRESGILHVRAHTKERSKSIARKYLLKIFPDMYVSIKNSEAISFISEDDIIDT